VLDLGWVFDRWVLAGFWLALAGCAIAGCWLGVGWVFDCWVLAGCWLDVVGRRSAVGGRRSVIGVGWLLAG
jgi:hypothetical protein